jgi:predicted small secreted protein
MGTIAFPGPDPRGCGGPKRATVPIFVFAAGGADSPRRRNRSGPAALTQSNAPARVVRLGVQEEFDMKKLFAILALSSTLLMAAACNTVRGAGQDVESAANAVDDAT